MRRAVLIAVVSLLATTSSGSAATTQNLYAWARETKPFVGVSTRGLNYGPQVARHVAPGRYRVRVVARSNLAFHLVGPGVDRQTRFTLELSSPVYETWRVALRRGRYRYSAEGVYAKQLRAAGVRIAGSLAVP